MWDLNDRLNYVFFEQNAELSSFKSDIDENILEKIRSYFYQRAMHESTPTFERVYSEKMLELIDKGLIKDQVKNLINAAKKEQRRQRRYGKKGDRNAASKYRVLKHAIFHLEQLL